MSRPLYRVASTPRERSALLEMVGLWGYPRPINANEAETSCVCRWGEHAIVWFNRDEDTPEGEVLVHLAAAPTMSAAHVATKGLRARIRFTAELLGYERLRVKRPVPDRLERLLDRLPEWQRDGTGWYAAP